MSLREITTPEIDQGASKGPPDILLPRNFEFDLPADEITEIEFLSLGHNANSSAQLQGISAKEVNRRLSSAQEHTGARNRYQLTTLSIQNRLIDLKIEDDPVFKPLTTGQDIVLRLVALGWTSSEIEAGYGIAKSGVDARILWAEKKLGANNRRHVIRKSFEKGIFKLDEPILEPRLIEDSTGPLRIAVDGIELSTSEIGLNTENELTIVRILGKLATGYFNGGIMSRNGFSPDSLSEHTRSNVYRIAAAKVLSKINKTFDEIILASHAPSRNYRYYYVVREMAIGTPEDMKTVKPVGIGDLPKTGGNQHSVAKTKPKPIERPPKNIKTINKLTPQQPVNPPVVEIDPRSIIIENPYLEQDSLPGLDQTLLAGLVPRLPAEVSTNRNVRQALREIMEPDKAPFDYRDKLVVSLRFGVPSKYPTTVSRREQTIRLEEIMKFIPIEQGINAASVSLITGLKPEVVLLTELAFLKKHQKQFPRLGPLIETVTNELHVLRKQNSQ